MFRQYLTILACAALIAASFVACGCRRNRDYDYGTGDLAGPSDYDTIPDEYGPEESPGYLALAVPEPINLLLPHNIDIHPFTGTQTNDEDGKPKAIEVRIKALDSFGDPTKAFGKFRFSLHQYRPYSTEHRGDQLAVWEEDLLEPSRNRRHWDPISQTYKFHLQWSRGLAPGSNYVLEAFFVSPFTEQLFDERVFVAEMPGDES